jgi:hypothetical protein
MAECPYQRALRKGYKVVGGKRRKPDAKSTAHEGMNMCLGMEGIINIIHYAKMPHPPLPVFVTESHVAFVSEAISKLGNAPLAVWAISTPERPHW